MILDDIFFPGDVSRNGWWDLENSHRYLDSWTISAQRFFPNCTNHCVFLDNKYIRSVRVRCGSMLFIIGSRRPICEPVPGWLAKDARACSTMFALTPITYRHNIAYGKDVSIPVAIIYPCCSVITCSLILNTVIISIYLQVNQIFVVFRCFNKLSRFVYDPNVFWTNLTA